MTDTIRVGANIQYNTSVKGKVSYHRSAGREVVWYIVYKLCGYATRMSPLQYINTLGGADNSWTTHGQRELVGPKVSSVVSGRNKFS